MDDSVRPYGAARPQLGPSRDAASSATGCRWWVRVCSFGLGDRGVGLTVPGMRTAEGFQVVAGDLDQAAAATRAVAEGVRAGSEPDVPSHAPWLRPSLRRRSGPPSGQGAL